MNVCEGEKNISNDVKQTNNLNEQLPDVAVGCAANDDDDDDDNDDEEDEEGEDDDDDSNNQGSDNSIKTDEQGSNRGCKSKLNIEERHFLSSFYSKYFKSNNSKKHFNNKLNCFNLCGSRSARRNSSTYKSNMVGPTGLSQTNQFDSMEQKKCSTKTSSPDNISTNTITTINTDIVVVVNDSHIVSDEYRIVNNNNINTTTTTTTYNNNNNKDTNHKLVRNQITQTDISENRSLLTNNISSYELKQITTTATNNNNNNNLTMDMTKQSNTDYSLSEIESTVVKYQQCMKCVLAQVLPEQERSFKGKLANEDILQTCEVTDNNEKILRPPNTESECDLDFDVENENHSKSRKIILHLCKTLHHLRCQIESFSYLSWLGLAEKPNTSNVAVPGRNAPPPNPQLHLIRRSDADCRRSITEYKRLCKQPVCQEVLDELRSVTFDNWRRTDPELIRLVREMFMELNFVKHYNLQYHRLDLWLTDIYRRYNRVPFHNYKHAFMVTQMCYVLLWKGNLTNLLDVDDQLTLIVSAICHDLDHPGFNNAYQINAGTELALRYNDQSPLENHHSAMAFDLLNKVESNPFAHLPTNIKQKIRQGIIKCILATDMSRHNDILQEYNNTVINDLDGAWKIDPVTQRPAWVTNSNQKYLVMMIILKISDISNEARPLNVAGPWINRLLSEFFCQSDYEKLVGLPVAPFMDRDKVTKSASQCGFIRFVILPLFEALVKLLPAVRSVTLLPALEQLNYYTEMQAQETQSAKSSRKSFSSTEK